MMSIAVEKLEKLSYVVGKLTTILSKCSLLEEQRKSDDARPREDRFSHVVHPLICINVRLEAVASISQFKYASGPKLLHATAGEK